MLSNLTQMDRGTDGAQGLGRETTERGSRGLKFILKRRLELEGGVDPLYRRGIYKHPF